MQTNRKIICSNGEIVDLAVWQQAKFGKEKSFDQSKLSNFFSTKERSFNKQTWLLHEKLFDILDLLRAKVNMPIRINSAYRTQAEQQELRNVNQGAVLNSPHVWGLAVDIDTETFSESLFFVGLLKEISQSLDIKIRLGYKKYKNYASFVHLDIAPEMFGTGKPWEMLPNVPEAFRQEITW